MGDTVEVSFGEVSAYVHSAFLKFLGAFGGDVFSILKFLTQRNHTSKSLPPGEGRKELSVIVEKHIVGRVYEVLDDFILRYNLTSRSNGIEALVLGSGVEWKSADSIQLASDHRLCILDKLNNDRLDNKLCDLEVNIGKSRVVWAHKCILAASSDYFAKLFHCDTKTITVRNLRYPEVFTRVLDFIYTGVITVDNKLSSEIFKVAKFLQLGVLEKMCKDYFMLSGQKFREAKFSMDLILTIDDTSFSNECTIASTDNSPNALQDCVDVDTIHEEETAPTIHPKLTNDSGGEKPKKYSCRICQSHFHTKSHLKRHMMSHSGERKYRCTTCGKLFLTADHLTRHNRTHSAERPYSCKNCEKKFKTKDNLKRHFLSHTDERPFFCEICAKQFKDKAGLLSHQKSHNKAEPVCPHCGKRFVQKNRLADHIIRHNNPFACDICGKTFAFKNHLQRHSMTHTGVRPYGCDVCGRKFTNTHALKLHHKTHTGLGLHNCPHCDRKFLDRFHLKRHMKRHTGEKPFKCELCEKSFSRADNCESHRKACTVKLALQKDMQSFTELEGCDGIKFKKVIPGKELLKDQRNALHSTLHEAGTELVQNIAIAVNSDEVAGCRYRRASKRPPELKLFLLKKDDVAAYLENAAEISVSAAEK